MWWKCDYLVSLLLLKINRKKNTINWKKQILVSGLYKNNLGKRIEFIDGTEIKNGIIIGERLKYESSLNTNIVFYTIVMSLTDDHTQEIPSSKVLSIIDSELKDVREINPNLIQKDIKKYCNTLCLLDKTECNHCILFKWKV